MRVCNSGPFAASFYTFSVTELDHRMRQISDNTTSTTIRVLGLVSYDPAKLLIASRTAAGNWRTISSWTRIPQRLAIIGYGITTDGCI